MFRIQVRIHGGKWREFQTWIASADTETYWCGDWAKGREFRLVSIEVPDDHRK